VSKAALYARAQVPEYWIVNLGEELVEVYRRPEAGVYREALIRRRGESLTVAAVPGIRVDVSPLFSEPE
jgi:Uma2 family endonuclease